MACFGQFCFICDVAVYNYYGQPGKRPLERVRTGAAATSPTAECLSAADFGITRVQRERFEVLEEQVARTKHVPICRITEAGVYVGRLIGSTFDVRPELKAFLEETFTISACQETELHVDSALETKGLFVYDRARLSTTPLVSQASASHECLLGDYSLDDETYAALPTIQERLAGFEVVTGLDKSFVVLLRGPLLQIDVRWTK